MGIIGKCCIWADENIIFYSCAIPDLHTRFYGNVISNKYITLYKGMCANVAISANSRTFENHYKLPNSRSLSNLA